MGQSRQKKYFWQWGEEFKKINPNAKLAINFQTIELKGKIDFNTSHSTTLHHIYFISFYVILVIGFTFLFSEDGSCMSV